MKEDLIIFKPSQRALSLGVELELQVLDGESLQLTPRAYELIDAVGDDNLKKEFFQSTLEVVTDVCESVRHAHRDLRESLLKVRSAASALDLALSSTGTHPEADYRERIITPSPRYYELADRNQWLIRRMAVYGMHIHIGVKTEDEAIRLGNFLLHFVPHVLALSASSPFWQRMDTGLAAARPTLYESMPTCGMPYLVKDWKQFQRLFASLKRSGSIQSMKDLWWDVRPSPAIGTVELRVCDEPATLREAMAITAFVHLLAGWYLDHEDEWQAQHKTIQRWMLRENKWRVIRFGLNAEIIVKRNRTPVPIAADIHYWLEKIAPYEHRMQYGDYVQALRNILDNGNSSMRQHRVFSEHDNLHEVTRFNVSEFENDLMYS